MESIDEGFGGESIKVKNLIYETENIYKKTDFSDKIFHFISKPYFVYPYIFPIAFIKKNGENLKEKYAKIIEIDFKINIDSIQYKSSCLSTLFDYISILLRRLSDFIEEEKNVTNTVNSVYIVIKNIEIISFSLIGDLDNFKRASEYVVLFIKTYIKYKLLLLASKLSIYFEDNLFISTDKERKIFSNSSFFTTMKNDLEYLNSNISVLEENKSAIVWKSFKDILSKIDLTTLYTTIYENGLGFSINFEFYRDCYKESLTNELKKLVFDKEKILSNIEYL
jgi:hypothetical protein